MSNNKKSLAGLYISSGVTADDSESVTEVTAGNPVTIEWLALEDERVKHSHSRKQDATFYEFDYEKSKQEMKPIIDAMSRRTRALFRELLDKHRREL